MKIGWGKDGGPKSKVYGAFFEIKSLFSLVLLRFNNGTRSAHHSHAFNAWSVLLKGQLTEEEIGGTTRVYTAPCFIRTPREMFHKVNSQGTSWVLSLRGPWAPTWMEVDEEGRQRVLAHGRKEVA